MRHILLLGLACMIFIHAGKAQDISVKGVVMEQKQDGSLVPVEFANVVWLKSTRNTTTDSTGYFFIAHAPEDGDKLIFQFLGFEPDTVKVKIMVEADPAVKSGRLTYRMHPWMAQRGSVLH